MKKIVYFLFWLLRNEKSQKKRIWTNFIIIIKEKQKKLKETKKTCFFDHFFTIGFLEFKRESFQKNEMKNEQTIVWGLNIE